MGVCDTYEPLKTQEKEELFQELFELKEQKAILDKRIKVLEKGYKDDLSNMPHDMFYKLKSGIRFSIRKSTRKGAVDTKKIEEVTGINCEDFRKESTEIYTLRREK